MPQRSADAVTPAEILSFWFPETLIDPDQDVHVAFWRSRMQGGMDRAIIETYADVTEAGARGLLDDWALSAEGRLALLIVTDQFPRSVWRGAPGAFGQDIKSCRMVMEGFANGHYDALPHAWQKNFYLIALSHCEGPDHLDRMDLCVAMADALVASLGPEWGEQYGELARQPRRVREIIRRFGRHPHRNAVLGRLSTPDEEAYIAEGDFPHERKIGGESPGG